MLETLFVSSSRLHTIKGTTHEHVVCVVPTLDQEQARRLAGVLTQRAKHPGLVVFVHDDARLGFIMVANLVYSWTSSPRFAYFAQDAYPGEQWLAQAMGALNAAGSGLLAFNDGRFFGTLAVFGLADRAWVKTLYPKSLFFPGYVSHFADTELSAIAYVQNKLYFNPNCLLIEVDYEKHAKQNNPDDHLLYAQRARTGFDGLIEPFDPDDAPPA